MSTKTAAMVAVVVLSNVFGNFFMGWGVKHQVPSSGWLGPILTLFDPWVAAGVALLILWMLSRMALLSWADLSYVLPVTSIGYVLNALLGRFLLAEQISPQRWAGTLLIVAGTTLVSLGSPSSATKAES
ncbi:MAG: EamA family transporter [Bryobacteraceae bacterium]